MIPCPQLRFLAGNGPNAVVVMDFKKQFKEIDKKIHDDVIILVRVVENVVLFTNLEYYYNGLHSKFSVFW